MELEFKTQYYSHDSFPPKIKYLPINLTKLVQERNFHRKKTLKTDERKQGRTKQMERQSMFIDGKDSILSRRQFSTARLIDSKQS